jgi:hypothetical protein
MELAGMEHTTTVVGTESDWIDLWFEADTGRPRPPGLLGRIARKNAIFLPSPAPPTEEEACDAMGKSLGLRAMQRRKGRDFDTPRAWLISTAPFPELIEAAALLKAPKWPAGVYMGPPLLGLWAIVLSELPVVRGTLLLRLLATGSVLERALSEQAELKPSALERRVTRAALAEACGPSGGAVPISRARADPIVASCRKAYYAWYRREGLAT